MRLRGLFLALALAGCESEQTYSLQEPRARERPPVHGEAAPHEARQAGDVGSAGPLKTAMVGRYMDAQEHDFRARLRLPISRVGDDIVVVVRNDLLFRGSDLTSSGGDLLERVSELLRHYDHTLVQIGAYTDTTGTSEQNAAVSTKRAKSVADALAADGVSAQRLSSQGYGSSHLKIATGPNVSEPRNRRIEIHIIAHPSAA